MSTTESPAAANPGQIIYFYDHDSALAMKSIDDAEPFAAIVASVRMPPPPPEVPAEAAAAGAPAPKPLPPLVNLLVIDHIGTTFALQAVPLFAAGDEAANGQRYHCETGYRKIEPPAAEAQAKAA